MKTTKKLVSVIAVIAAGMATGLAAPNDGPKLTVTSGLVCWFDAAVGVTGNKDGVVQTWKDLSGNEHHASLFAGSPVLAPNQVNGRPAVQFRTGTGACGLNLDKPFFSGQQFVVVRSPNAKWNKDGCFLGRRWARSSCYRLGGNSSAFWGDQYPQAVAKNGKAVNGHPFDLAPITEFMVLRIDVNDGDMSDNTYQIGMADMASCDFDVAEILGYQSCLSASEEKLVGGYLAAKYAITTAYPAFTGQSAPVILENLPVTTPTGDTAELGATLTCPGLACDVWVCWGPNNGGTDAALWANSAPLGTLTDVTGKKVTAKINGLTQGANYHYTFRATSQKETFWAPKVMGFRAGPAVTGKPGGGALAMPVTKGLACWYDAAEGMTTKPDGTIESWKDLSGNEHHATPGGGTPVRVMNQLNAKPAVQFRKNWLALAGTFFAKEHYIVIRSTGAKWSGASGILGRLKGRLSSYNTFGNDNGFWTDQSPNAVSKNGVALPGPVFDCSPITGFMILKIVVNDHDTSAASYALGNNDGLASGEFDVAEVLGYQSVLSPADEALVGGYLAAKYGLVTQYPPFPPAAPKPFVNAATKYKGWQHSGSFWLLTTPDGANLPASANEENFPVLVRLNKDGFDFSQAKANGDDLRFATAAGQPLAYQIDYWDAAAGMAGIWVRVPVIKGNARQEIKIYWGKADAAGESNGAAVFNASNGYLSVWHMNDPVTDDAGTLESQDLDSSATAGVIGPARKFAGGKGVFCGDKIRSYPFMTAAHTTEAWFKADRFNTTLLSWGKMDAVNLKLLCGPSRIGVEGHQNAMHSARPIPKSEWMQVVYTYDGQNGWIYLNGQADTASPVSAVRHILTPVRMQIGTGFPGALDEVRVSKVARSADWVKLQYENQQARQTLVGPLVRAGSGFEVAPTTVVLLEGKTTTLTAKAGGAQKVYWIAKTGDSSSVLAVDQFQYTLDAGRVTGDQKFTLQFKAVFADGAKTLDIPVTLREDIPDPVFTLKAPAQWNGRDTVEVVPAIHNLAALKAKGVGELHYAWDVTGGVVMKEIAADRLILKLSQFTGPVTVKATLNNGGAGVVATGTINVTEPKIDPWLARTPEKDEKPEDGQFFARDDKDEGTLYYNGTLDKPADSVFLKVYADDKLIKTETAKPAADNSYSLTAKLKAGLIKYKVEFGTKSGAAETVEKSVGNLVCGDAWLIDGQSNALALDTGEQSPNETSEWIRSYGGPTGRGDSSDWVRDRFGNNTKESPNKRTNLWCSPAWRSIPGSHAELGWWGMDLAKKLLASRKMPICIIQAAVGGTRIDEHKRNEENPLDLKTMYGKMLWRVRNARLTHGIRGVLWHQGEADQGLDGPDGGYGWETYQQYFVNMSLAWKQDMPNIRHYYVFQIWPNGCGQGGGHGDMLREVQRTLQRLYSNMDVMSTLGIKPPGPCHYPLAGWSEFVRLMQPLIERDTYGRKVPEPITAPDLKRAYYTSAAKDAIALEFDQPVIWLDSLAGQFYLDDQKDKVDKGAVNGNVITLKLKAPATAAKITYLKELNWNQNDLIFGKNGIAALTFCDVTIETKP